MADTKTTALTNYTNPDPAVDVIPIADVANSTTKKITRNNLLGITSTPVGINDTQVLTAKTLTAPTISSPILSGTITGTYTLAGTPTFPSSVVTLTGSQTLTNKILTSPTINAPTITNASITADAITGFTSANTGTIYGVAVTAGLIVGSAVTNIPAASLGTGAITLGYAKITAAFTGTATSLTLITGLSVAVTVPNGGRSLKVTFGGSCNASAGAGNNFTLDIFDSTTSAEVGSTGIISIPTASFSVNATFVTYIPAPSAGSHTYQVRYTQSAAGTFTCNATATGPAFILVEAI